jgi:hypothetical protein
MKFHSKIFGWEYAWQEFANERGGIVELNPESQPSLKYIQLPLGTSGNITFMPELHVGNPSPDGNIIAFYPAVDNFVFALHTEKFIDQVGKLLGMQDIVIGDSELDTRFVIQSNDPNRFKAILQNPQVRTLLLERPEINLRVYPSGDKLPLGSNVPGGQHALHYKQHGRLDSFEELQAVYQLFALLVGQSFVEAEAEVEAPLRPRFSESLLHR